MTQEAMVGRLAFLTGMKDGITMWLGGWSRTLLLPLKLDLIVNKCLPPSLRLNILSCKIGVLIPMISKVGVGVGDNVSKVANTKQGLNKRYPCWD